MEETPKDDEINDSLKKLQEYLDTTPKEELERVWQEVENLGIEGPTVEEYFQMQNPQYMYAKGFQEGAKKFKELVEEHLKNSVESIKSNKENLNKGIHWSSPKYLVYNQVTLENYIEDTLIPAINEIYENN